MLLVFFFQTLYQTNSFNYDFTTSGRSPSGLYLLATQHPASTGLTLGPGMFHVLLLYDPNHWPLLLVS